MYTFDNFRFSRQVGSSLYLNFLEYVYIETQKLVMCKKSLFHSLDSSPKQW